MMKIEQMVLGYSIRVEMHKLDLGWDIGIYGGSRTHVGAVSIASPDKKVETMEFPGHKESVITAQWAEQLSQVYNAPICVRCGIHYENATKEQIKEIVDSCEKILQKLN